MQKIHPRYIKLLILWNNFFLITIGTLCLFSFLVHGFKYFDNNFESLPTQSFWDVEFIIALQNMFSLFLETGQSGFLILHFNEALLLPFRNGEHSFTTTISDYLISMGFVYEKENTRKTLNKTHCVLHFFKFSTFIKIDVLLLR